MRHPMVVLLSLAIPVLLVSGCSSSGTTASDYSAAEAGQDSAPEAAAPGQDAGGTSFATAADRQVITEGSIDITVKDPRAAARAATGIVESAGGRVDELNERASSGDDGGNAQLTVRIPSAKVTATIDAIEQLGDLENISLAKTDVTGTAVDLDARIDAMKISIQRLEDMLGRATTSSELVSAESALTQRQMDLESMQSQRAQLADQVSMSTIHLNLWPEGTAPPKTPHGFWQGLVTGWNSLVKAIAAGLVVLGTLLPWLAFFALIGALIWWIVRVTRRFRPVAAPRSPAPPMAPWGPGPVPGVPAGMPMQPGAPQVPSTPPVPSDRPADEA